MFFSDLNLVLLIRLNCYLVSKPELRDNQHNSGFYNIFKMNYFLFFFLRSDQLIKSNANGEAVKMEE